MKKKVHRLIIGIEDDFGLIIYGKKRESKGEFNNLFNDLKYDVQKFYDYHRMDYEKFQALLNISTIYLKTEDQFSQPH